MSVDNRTQLNACESAGDTWNGDDSVTDNSLTGLFYEGTQSLSTQLSNALERMTCSTIGGTRDLSDASVWFLVKDNLADDKASGGHQIVLDDGTDEIGFYCNGNDDPPLQLSTYFLCLKLDVSNRSALTANAYAGVTANLTDTAITGVGYGSLHTAKAQGAIDNVFLDRFTFIANTSYALTINAGTVGTPETFADVAADDITNGWGMISNLQGSKFDINASFEWGDTANANSYFVDSDFQLFIDARDMGVGNFIIRTIAGTGTNVLDLTAGLFQNLGTPAVWDLSDTGMNEVKFESCTWVDAGTILFPVVSASNRFVNNCIFNNCGQITFSTIDVESPIINGTTDANGAILLDTAGDSDAILNATFNSDGTGHAIEITATGTYDFDNWAFTGYGADGTTDAVVFNDSGGAVTINVLNGGDTPTVRNGTSATTTINNSVTVTIAGVTEGTPVKVIADETAGTFSAGDVVSEGFADSTGAYSFSLNYEGAFGAGLDVVVKARNQGVAVASIADDGGAFTDETAEAASNATGDMTLLPATPAAGDAYYFAHNTQFSALKLDISTALVQSVQHTIVWEYWNGAWVALSGVVDGTDQFETAGENIVSWTLPGDWATTTVNSQGPLYYVRARLSVLGTITTAPVGRKVQLNTTRYLPYKANRVITSSGLLDNATWTEDTIATF